MSNQSTTSDDPAFSESINLKFLYFLGAIGFGCSIGLDLTMVIYGPALPVLSYTSVEHAFALRVICSASLVLSFAFIQRKADMIYLHRRILFYGSFLSLLPLLSAIIGHTIGPLPFAVNVLFWALFGFGIASLMMQWVLFFSLIPSRRTAFSYAGAACIGTLLFGLIAPSHPPALSLLGAIFLLASSIALLAFLFRQINDCYISPLSDYSDASVLKPAGIVSGASQSVIYGFVTLYVCSLGLIPAVICGLFGLIGSGFAALWGLLGSRVDISISMVQRISLPLIIVGLLFFPYFGDFGIIIFGSLVNIALAHSSIASASNILVESKEFQLHPIKRYASYRTPNWLGFLAGSILAFIVFLIKPTDLIFELIIAGLIILVVVAFCFYNPDEAGNTKRLQALLTFPEESEDDNLEDPDTVSSKEEQRPAAFREKCKAVQIKYKLTPRECEVFLLLAKGRNAEYIQRKLVLGASTVKTHIYHIYRKMDINSQQSLLDIVDEENDYKRE